MAVTGSVPVNETAIATENIAGEKTIEGMTIVDERRLEITVHLPLPMGTLIKLRMIQTEKKASEYQCTNRMNHLSCLFLFAKNFSYTQSPSGVSNSIHTSSIGSYSDPKASETSC
jgi:hypothetical protein